MAKVLVTEDTVTIAVSSASLKRWVWEGAGRYRVGAPKNTQKSSWPELTGEGRPSSTGFGKLMGGNRFILWEGNMGFLGPKGTDHGVGAGRLSKGRKHGARTFFHR